MVKNAYKLGYNQENLIKNICFLNYIVDVCVHGVYIILIRNKWNMVKKMLTTKEISEMLHVSEETVRRWIRNNALKAKQEGKSYFVERKDLLEFLGDESKISKTTLGKVDAILPGIFQSVLKAGADVAIGMAASKLMNNTQGVGRIFRGPHTQSSTVGESHTVNQSGNEFMLEEVEERIESLEMKRRELELEFQTKLLEVDKEIAKYKKIKKQLSQ
jgi:excisionase family DNA binding protein